MSTPDGPPDPREITPDGTPHTKRRAGTDPVEDLELLLRSRYGVVVLDTPETDRAAGLLRHLADRIDVPLFSWTPTKGLRRDGAGRAIYGTVEPGGALDHIESARFPAVYCFEGAETFLADPILARKLRDASVPLTEIDGALVLTGGGIELPEPLRHVCATLSLPPPDVEEFQDLLERILRDLGTRGRVKVEQTPAQTRQLLENLRGLTLIEAEKVLTKAIVEDGHLSPADIRAVAEAKRTLIEREGLLEYYPVEDALSEVADLATLKEWLSKRHSMIRAREDAEEFGLSFPRGVLLLGVPGCGKSLSAKAVAMEWGLPLLKLDPSGLYNKYIGESEKNFRRAITTAERMAPVVLWIDEIENAFSGADDRDAGVAARIFGSFLSWLQERRGDVFVVATANDVARLPPEFLRKGRFDEILFVDLPDEETRNRIFRIHLEKRGHDPDTFDLRTLADASEGFSGSEIEQVVVAGLYTAFAGTQPLTTGGLLHEISATRPLSQLMPERIGALREWAAGRTVPAN
jgi:hypothetical protein